jgi:hypothetical protein
MGKAGINREKRHRAELSQRAAAHKKRMETPSGKGKYALRKERQAMEERVAERLAKKDPHFARPVPQVPPRRWSWAPVNRLGY